MRDKVLIIIFLLIITILPMIIFIRNPKSFSSIENRELSTFIKPNVKNILKGKFQNNIEKTLSDQMISSETIKRYFYLSKHITGDFIINYLYKDAARYELIPTGEVEGIYKIGHTDYLVYEPIPFERMKEKLQTHIKVINSIDNNYNIDMYIFFVNKDVDVNSYKDFNNYMVKNLNKGIKYDYLKNLDVGNNYYENYKQYFYKTDHHWNYKGSYEGYKIIMDLLDEEVLPIKGEKCFKDIKYLGTKGARSGDFLNYDKFCVYEFDVDENEVYINREKAIYGNKESYYQGYYPKQIGYNHYAGFYGSDYGEVIYDFHNKKDNLLIFSNSYSNPINELIASSFNKTYIIDLRAYELDLGKTFDIDSYIKENKIDKILFLGDYNFYTDIKFLIPNI